jgi:hypothetical protein
MAISKNKKSVSENLLEELVQPEVHEVADVVVIKQPDVVIQPDPVLAKPRTSLYVLFINDQYLPLVSVDGSTQKVPSGDWYCLYVNWDKPEVHGPFPFLVPSNKGQQTLTGFIQEEVLRSYAITMYKNYAKDGWREPTSPVDTTGGWNKIMSAKLFVD